MCTILVSGASTIIGYGILKSLRQAYPENRLIGTSVHENSVAPSFCDIFETAPFTKDEKYTDWLVQIIKKHNVSIIIPGIEIDVLTWSKHRIKIEQSGVKLLLNNPELIQLCADKWQFYMHLAENSPSLAIPSSLEFDENNHKFPLLLKPRKGSGSRGITIVENREKLEQNLKKQQGFVMIQPIVGTEEEEYTTAGFFNIDSQLCAYITLKRKLSSAGFTESAETVEIEGIENALLDLGAVFKPIGPTNFQFRLEDSQLKLLEINPRISSSTSIRTAFGYNESAMGVSMFLDNRLPEQPLIKTGRAFRYVEDFIDYDSPNI